MSGRDGLNAIELCLQNRNLRIDDIDLAGGYVSPGYIDLHVHGGDGSDFMDGTADAFRTI